MNYNSKVKKLSAILSSIAVTLGTISLTNFASAPTGESDNTSSTQSTASEQTVNSSSSEQTASNSSSEQTVSNSSSEQTVSNSSKSKIIKIDEPGDYRLVGINSASSNSEDPNTIIVNTTDQIIINGSGEYNITLDNVNIDIKKGDPSIDSVYGSGFDGIIESSRNGAKINLILEGENILKTNFCRTLSMPGINLTISEESENSSLEISGLYEGIFALNSNITINGGTIDVNSCRNIGIITNNMTINGGNLIVDRIRTGIQFDDNLIINGGIVTLTNKIQDENQGVNGITMDGETTTVITDKESGEKYYLGEQRFGIRSYRGNMVVNGGIISASGTQGNDYSTLDFGINCYNIKFNGGSTQSNGIFSDKQLIFDGGMVETESIFSPRITIKNGELNGLKYINRRPFDVQNVKNGEIKMDPIPKTYIFGTGTFAKVDQLVPYFPLTSYLNVTGGTINGVSFPTTGSAASTAFDKELSNDDIVASEKASDTIPPAKTPNTGKASEVNTFLICTFLGLIFTTVSTLKKSKILN